MVLVPVKTGIVGGSWFEAMSGATGANPAGLTSGIARIGVDGRGAWVVASAASGNPAFVKVARKSAPALSMDLRTPYVAVNSNAAAGTRQSGALLAPTSTTLAH